MKTSRIGMVLWTGAVIAGLTAACSLKSGSGSGASASGGGSGASKGNSSPIDLSLTVSDAPTTGALAGRVLDENSSPIANATVTADTLTTTTDANGAYALAPTPGRVLITVTATGTVSREQIVGVTSESPGGDDVTLIAASAPQTAPAAGGSITTGFATLDVPAGAYASDVMLSATWIDLAHVAAASGRVVFVDDNGQHSFVGQIHIDAPSEPMLPVTLRVPVAASNPVLYEILNGEPSGRIAPTSVTAGVASFPVSHFSSYSVFEESAAAPPEWVLTAGAVIDTAGNVYHPGDKVPAGQIVKGGPFTAVSSNGEVLRFEGTPVKLDNEADGTPSATCIELCNVRGESKPFIGPINKIHFLIKTRSAASGVRGTVFSLSQHSCSEADGSAIDKLEVFEGDVDFNLAGQDVDVPAGKQATGCDGCADPKQATCDCDPIACQKAGGECLPSPCVGYLGSGLNKISGCFPKGSTCCAPNQARLNTSCGWYGIGPYDTGLSTSGLSLCVGAVSICGPDAVCECNGTAYSTCALRAANPVCTQDHGADVCGQSPRNLKGNVVCTDPGNPGFGRCGCGSCNLICPLNKLCVTNGPYPAYCWPL